MRIFEIDFRYTHHLSQHRVSLMKIVSINKNKTVAKYLQFRIFFMIISLDYNLKHIAEQNDATVLVQL